jgi:PAS domain S-box-containing protein
MTDAQPELAAQPAGRGSPPRAQAPDLPGLRSMVSVDELLRRPSRPPDYQADSGALVALAQAMAVSPESILQKLAETALALCRAQSAGLSLLEDVDQRSRFHWRAIAGEWAPHRGGGTPRDFGPCGTVLDVDAPMVCSHPELDFPYWAAVEPVLEEALLVPFYVDGEAIGTIWVVAHDSSRRFDAEDLRLLTSLGAFASAAYQTDRSLNAAQRLASIVESSSDAILGKDLDGVITSWNRAAERIFGYSAEEVVGRPVTVLIPPEGHDEEVAILEQIRRGERIDHYETVRIRKDGSPVDLSLTVSPIRNAQGRIVGASSIARDIGERRQAEAKIELLAREAEHRSKNVLATVLATVRLTDAETAVELREAIEGRIQALANAHELFAGSRWAGARIRSLIERELAPYTRGEDGRARLHGPDLVLRPERAQALAVALHELATNAAKHGALSVPDGQVEVDWSHVVEGRRVVRWTESGGPPVAPPTRRGFGTRVMEGMVQGQPEGEIRFDWRPEGLVCEISLPT